MATQLQLRRDIATDIDAMTPVVGEPIVDTTNKRIRLGDGSTAGGIIIPNAFDLQKQSFSYVAVSGTDTLTGTLSPAPSSYNAGMTVLIKAASNNTGSVTVNFNGLGAVTVKKNNGADNLEALDFIAAGIYQLTHDGTNFQASNTSGGTAAASNFVTGDGILTINPTAPSGWVMANDGTIGNAASGGTTRANADTEALFTLIWNQIADTYAPVSSGRGASAAADFAADKTIKLGSNLGRALAIAGDGSGLTSRALGQFLGAETHALTAAENATHTHPQSIDDASGVVRAQSAHSSTAAPTKYGARVTVNLNAAASAVSTLSSGSGTAHNNMQPTSFMWNVKIKL